MRLWHIDLIQKLPRQQLLGQWREIHAIIGTLTKHGKVNHSTVNYVNDHPVEYLYAYAWKVYKEMIKRGYHPSWVNIAQKFEHMSWLGTLSVLYDGIYPEHNDAYLQECIDNLKEKGITIE